VIVGIGQITYHPEEHPDTPHPLQLAKRVVEAAAEDCGSRAVLSRADSVTVINMFSHAYGDPAGQFCEMLGIRPRVREYTAMGGNTPQWLVNRAADRIARGTLSIASCGRGMLFARYRHATLAQASVFRPPEMVGNTVGLDAPRNAAPCPLSP
jgi:acetyl-CoA C-acetyltransferase